MIYDDLYIFEKWWLVHSSIPSTRGAADCDSGYLQRQRKRSKRWEIDGGPESPKRFSFMGFSRTEIPEILESLKVYRKSLSNFGWFGCIFEETLNHWIAENNVRSNGMNSPMSRWPVVNHTQNHSWGTIAIAPLVGLFHGDSRLSLGQIHIGVTTCYNTHHC